MKSELHMYECPEMLQTGELVVGLSSTIPGFIRKSSSQSAISFAPFYMRNQWVDLPMAIISNMVPANGSAETRLSIALRPGSKRDKILAEIIAALAPNSGAANANGAGQGICCNCKLGGPDCVDCFLSE
jgi:hypothetical protein